MSWVIFAERRFASTRVGEFVDGDLGLSTEDGKKIMEALQNAVVHHEAETYSLYRRVCPNCHRF
jgi:hypothetical protein